MARFDPHRPDADGNPQYDPADRSVLYIGEDLATSACEVFGYAGEAPICPNYRVALLRPTRALNLFDLTEPGNAMSIGALPTLSDGDLPRDLTQAWATAIYEDQPLGPTADGIHYRSGYTVAGRSRYWDSAAKVELDPAPGADIALSYPGMLGKLKVELQARHIVIRTITSEECSLCE